MKYKAVIFDLDDTLCNTSEVIDPMREAFYSENLSHFPGKSVQELMKIHDQAFEETVLNSNLPVNTAYILFWYRLFELLKIKPSIRAVHKFTEYVTKELSLRINLMDGSLDLLEYLRANNIKIGVLTNGTFYQQTNKLIALTIDHLIDYLVTPDMCLVAKPDPKAFHYILEKLQVKPEESLMIGNNFTADIVGAKRAGMDAVYLDLGTNKKTNEVRPDFRVTSLKDIISWLR